MSFGASARILASTARKSAHICLRASVKALDRRPCFQCAAAIRALPSGVLGPVDSPPCSRQRVLPVSGGFWHAVPRRVFAPQLWRGRSGPKRQGIPFSRLVFVMAKSPPLMGFYYTPFWMVWLGARLVYCIPRVIYVLFNIPSKAHTRLMLSILGWIIYNVW